MKNMTLVTYDSSTTLHTFGLNVSIEFKDELIKLIDEALDVYNGFVKLCSDYTKIYSVVYETTDDEEFDVDTAEAISKAIDDAVKKLTVTHGGFEAICE
jgi:hypothetical protein